MLVRDLVIAQVVRERWQVPRGCAVMKKAMPEPAWWRRQDCRHEVLSGNARAVIRSATSFLPVFHVVISVKAARQSQETSPLKDLHGFAPSDRSTARKTIATRRQRA
jgi:hypothetical protein